MSRNQYALAIIFLALVQTMAQAQTFNVLYYLSGSSGIWPEAGLIQDASGNLYGTATYGGDGCGDDSCGVVFMLDTNGKETVLHNFAGPDGDMPEAPLLRDDKGNLYGTTAAGGNSNQGAVFKIDTAGNETVLHSFVSKDGCQPRQGLIMDEAGNLYGTTSACGNVAHGSGTIFRLSKNGEYAVLHNFAGSPSDGAAPDYGRLTLDTAGNLYGVTFEGGNETNCSNYYVGCGVLYKLSKDGKFVILHRFAGGTSDGCYPYGTVALDGDGGLHGTTFGCGAHGWGIIWKVCKEGVETIRHNFAGGTSDGCNPEGSAVLDAKGNLYGNSRFCGAYGGGWDGGTVWELSKKNVLTLLHSFDQSDGAQPWGEVLRTENGTLFGTTTYGGSDDCSYGCGTVWSVAFPGPEDSR